MTVAEALSSSQARAKKSLRQISKETGLSVSFVKMVFDDKSTPSRVSASKIATSLGMTPEETLACFLHWSWTHRAEVRAWDLLGLEHVNQKPVLEAAKALHEKEGGNGD